MLNNNEKGQSLIEVLVVGVVAAMMILALVVIILSSLKNAQFAQNQTQATQLAQDTVDKIRVLRDENKYNTITYGSGYCFKELWGNMPGDPLNCGRSGSYCYYKLINDSTLNKVDNSALSVDNLSGVFSRQITINQTSADIANLVVTITWQDSSGTHSSKLETVITKPNYDCKL